MLCTTSSVRVGCKFKFSLPCHEEDSEDDSLSPLLECKVSTETSNPIVSDVVTSLPLPASDQQQQMSNATTEHPLMSSGDKDNKQNPATRLPEKQSQIISDVLTSLPLPASVQEQQMSNATTEHPLMSNGDKDNKQNPATRLPEKQSKIISDVLTSLPLPASVQEQQMSNATTEHPLMSNGDKDNKQNPATRLPEKQSKIISDVLTSLPLPASVQEQQMLNATTEHPLMSNGDKDNKLQNDVIEDASEDFAVISDGEICRSLSASSPYNTFLEHSSESKPRMHMNVPCTIEDIENCGSDGSSGEVWVNAGCSYGLPVLLEEPGVTLSWEISSEAKSIPFSVAFKEAGDVSKDVELRCLLKSTKIKANQHPVEGHLVARCPGVYILVFDNRFSRFRAHKVNYRLKIQRTNIQVVQRIYSDGEVYIAAVLCSFMLKFKIVFQLCFHVNVGKIFMLVLSNLFHVFTV
ncbi:uncharacterized protein LOC143224692 isoform X2 [Tachypleus tridentatus]|uniref:uncharacterized protein LOC143224692 isoform X2 n=1 Tax=Tachypleus tridentatus TaxID=6853 RepID=UPI003FCFDCE7